MKFISLAATAITCALLGYSENSQAQQQQQQQQSFYQAIPDANFIPADTANKMIHSYLTSIGGSSSTDLRSLIISAQSLRNYLNDTSITQVKVMFAHTLDYINAGNNGVPAGYTPGALTIVLAGYNSSGNYVYATGNMVMDYAKPCPTNCNTLGGTAANSLLQ